jgi:hypothetical protein
MLLNPVASNNPKWQTLQLLRWMKNMHQSMWDHEELQLVTTVTTSFS